MSKSKNNFVPILFLIIVIGIGAYLISRHKTQNASDGVMCTMEAKLCPDGSYVARSGPKCEFAECPPAPVIDTSTWKTSTDAKTGVTFKYPATLSTTYIQTVDWPPKVQVIAGPFSCTDAGEPNAPAGQTVSKIINGHTYCVTTEAQGAAGSTYTQYAYAWQAGSKVLYFTFTLRAPQCANYEDPKKTECETERSTFNIDNITDAIIQTATVK